MNLSQSFRRSSKNAHEMTVVFPHSLSVSSVAVLWLAGALSPALAQTPPDAGQTLQEQAPALEAPVRAKQILMEIPPAAKGEPGGARVELQAIVFAGNTLFTDARLREVIGDVKGQSFDLAGLRGLADKVSEFYRAGGYPFARAFIPQQSLTDGALRIEVIEGRYGSINVEGEPRLNAQALAFLSRLKSDAVIESSRLERAVLLLDDQPGLDVTPIVRPGQQLGTGDLDVRIRETDRRGAEVGIDNFGNRYSGQWRMKGDAYLNNPFRLGDQVRVNGLYTEEGMWFGSLAYLFPIGVDGLRGNVSYTHTYYELGEDFANLRASGTAKVASAGLSYPLIRSRAKNLSVSGTYQHKELEDRQGATSTSTDKSSDTLPIAVSFDARDAIGGGGITYGVLSWTHGRLELGSTLKANDATTARTDGTFNKFNVDVARLQGLPAQFSLHGRVSAQWADKNLDSSEGFGLGGPKGVRAYPTGEGYGDEGWLAQVELRRRIDAFTPYVFYDAGRVKINAKPWTSGANHRSLGGVGIGLGYAKGGWTADAALAWRTRGGKPTSDTRDEDPRAWLSIAYRF